MKIGEHETHPAADAFPLLQGEAWTKFLASVKRGGLQRRTLVLYQGKLLDGRNRLRAALELGLEVEFTTYDGDDPVTFVKMANLDRSHYSESVRAMIAAKLVTLPRGRQKKSARSGALSRDEAAEQMNVSHGSVAAARTVLAHGTPELVKAVESGELAVTAAAELAKLEPAEQLERLEAGRAPRPRPKELASPLPAAEVLTRAIVRLIQHQGGTVKRLAAGELRVAFNGAELAVCVRNADEAERAA